MTCRHVFMFLRHCPTRVSLTLSQSHINFSRVFYPHRTMSVEVNHHKSGATTKDRASLAKTSPEFNAPALFVCDIQERFREGIHEFRHVITTTQKVLKASKILSIPIFVTTQLSAKLGPTVKELCIDAKEGNSYRSIVHCDKTRFSMWTPDVIAAAAKTYPSIVSNPELQKPPNSVEDLQQQHAEQAQLHHASDLEVESQLPTQMQVALVGIETHICIAQTVRDLVRAGHKVYVLADGVSSCNKEDGRVALARLRQEGAIVTTSEAWIFEVVGDATAAEFKEIAALVRESKQTSKDALAALCGGM